MPFTQTDIDNLDAQYKLGAKRFRFQDREIELDIDMYLKLRTLMQDDVARQNGQQPVRHVRIATGSGF
jgi:hypothetical protein